MFDKLVKEGKTSKGIIFDMYEEKNEWGTRYQVNLYKSNSFSSESHYFSVVNQCEKFITEN